MDTNAPWRALEASQDGPGEAAPGRSRPVALLLAAAVAILVVGSLAVVALVGMQPGGKVQVVAGPNGAAPAVAVSQALVVVQVAGAVARPGVYSLPVGSRVADAIRAAGGYSTDVDPRAAEARLNLAAKLQDSQAIVVPRRGEAAGASGAPGTGNPSAPSGSLNLNTATSAQLDALPGIGPATATKIIASREQRPFTSINDLTTRKLVTAATLAKFRDQVSV